MRKLLLSVLLVLFWTVPSFARNVITFFSPEAGVVCDTCTGESSGRSFSWHMEDDTITTGTPCGCVNSGGDASATRTNATLETTQKSDGSKSLYVAGANYYARFDSSSANFDPANGTVKFDLFIASTGYASAGMIWQEGSTDERIWIYMTGSSSAIDFNLSYRADATTLSCEVSSDKNPGSGGAWYEITAAWKTGVSGNDMVIQVCDLNPSTRSLSNCASQYRDRDLTAIDTPSYRYIGNYTSNAPTYYIDNFHLTKGDSGF